LGRLHGRASFLPALSIFIYAYVRKKALLSSQIEGTQSSLSDLLLFENEEVPGVPIEDVQDVSNYVAALSHDLKRIREGFPLSLRLIREIHEMLLPWGQDRLVPIFLATQAIRQKSPQIMFESAAEMLSTFGMQQGGSQYRRLVASFQRIFGATIFFGTDSQSECAAVVHRARFNFMTEARIWYFRDPDQKLSQIGKFYNGRHHTTVLHAIGKIEKFRHYDDSVDALLEVLTAELAAGPHEAPPELRLSRAQI